MRWPRGPRGAWRLLPRRSLLAALFLFSLSSSFLYFVYVAPGIVNTYLFMMQAQGIMIRENMRTIGAQVYEQVVRSAYAKRNSSVNDSDYPLDLNHNETFLQATTFLPEDFTYFPNHTCPERLPSMSEYQWVHSCPCLPDGSVCPLPHPAWPGWQWHSTWQHPISPVSHLSCGAPRPLMNGSAVLSCPLLGSRCLPNCLN